MEFFGFRTQKWRAPPNEQRIAALREEDAAEIKHEQHAPPPPPEEASEVSLTSASEVEADADAHAIDLNMLTAPKACSSESEDAGDTTDSTRTPVLTGRREQVQKTDLGEQVYFDLADILANGRSDSETGAQTAAELQLEKNAGAQEGTSAVAADPLLPPEGQCGVGGEEKGNGTGEEMEIGMEKVETGEVIELEEKQADEHDEIEGGAGAVAKKGEQDEGMGEVISSSDVARQRLLEVLISQYGEEGAAAAMKQIFAEDAEDEAEGGEAGEMVSGNQHPQGTSNGASDHDRELYGEEANALELDFQSPTGNTGDALPEGGGFDLGCEGGPGDDQMVGLFPAAEEKGTTSAPHQQHSFSLLHMLQGGSDVVEDGGGAAAEDQEGRVEISQEWNRNEEEHYDAVEISDYYGTNEREASEHFDETSYQAFLAQHYGYHSQWGDHSGTTWAAGYDQEQDHRQGQFQYPPVAAAVTATNATGNAPPAEAKNGDEGPPVVAAGSKPKTSFPDPTKQEELARKLQSLIAQVKSGGNSSSGEEETSADQQQPQNNGALPSGAVVAGSGTSFVDHSYYAAQSKGQQKGAQQQMRAAAQRFHDTQQLSNSFAPHQQQLRSRKGLGKSRGGKGEGPARQQAPLHPLLRPLPPNASAKMRAQHAAAAAALSQVGGHGQQNAWSDSSRQMQANYATPADARGSYNHGNINQSHRAGRHQPGGNTNLVAQYQSYLARSQGRERGSGHPRGGGGGQQRGGQHRGGRNRLRHNPGQGAGRAMGQGFGNGPQGMSYSWGNAGYGNQNHGYDYDVGSTGARSASSSFQPGPRMPGKGNEGARASGAAEGQEKHEGKKEVDHLVKMAKELLGILGQNEAEA